MSSLSHYAVIGSPVNHSLSPMLFQALFKHLKVPADYVAKKVTSAELPQALEALRQGQFDGYSVTLPHKELALELLDEVDAHAARIGAVNCIKRTGQRLVGYNTDALGFQRALEHAGVPLRGARILILGAGGAGRACAFTALDHGVNRLYLTNRTFERAQILYEALSSRIEWDMDVQVLEWNEGLSAVMNDVDVIVNATSVGMGLLGEDPLPEAFALTPRHRVFDLVYRPLKTPLLERAQQSKAKTIDGLWMLVFQALEQFRIFTGQTTHGELAQRLHQYLAGISV